MFEQWLRGLGSHRDEPGREQYVLKSRAVGCRHPE